MQATAARPRFLARILLPALTVLLLAGAPPAPVFGAEPDWSTYNALLQQYVSARTVNGTAIHFVNYGGLRSDPRWPAVVRSVETHAVTGLSPAQKLAFYINAYNILAINMIVQNYPVSTINALNQGSLTVWKRPAGNIGGRSLSLDDIEHSIIRPMGDARIHFAVVCASLSCPDLRREAYTASRLNAQLDDQARRFLSNPGKGLRVEGNVVHVTKLFEWFAEDFTRAAGSVEAFVRRYVTDLPAGAQFRTDIPYLWNLNGA